MQPVVELRRVAASYTYGVRAPRAGGVVPPVSYRNEAACLRDVASGLGGNFSRIYVRLEGLCVGERNTSELWHEPEQVAAALEETLRAARETAAT